MCWLLCAGDAVPICDQGGGCGNDLGKAIEGATVVYNKITRKMLLLQKNSSQQINIIINKQREKYKFRFN